MNWHQNPGPLVDTPLPDQLEDTNLHPAVLSGDLKSRDCHKFEGCSAPVCPLDACSMRAPHYDGEPICFLLSEYSKPTAKDDLRGAIGDEQYEVIQLHYPIVFERYGPIRKRLKRASTTGSRLGGVRDKD